MTLRRVKLSDLNTEDWSIYPRSTFSSHWVSTLMQSLEDGANLPPPVVARAGMRVVDGWHRVAALRKFLGKEAEIEADVRTYKSSAAAMRAAVELNDPETRNALPLTAKDRETAMGRMEEAGIPVAEIAASLHMPEQRIRVILAPALEERPATSENARKWAEKAQENARRQEEERQEEAAQQEQAAGGEVVKVPGRGPAFWARLGHVRNAVVALKTVQKTVTRGGQEMEDPEYQKALGELGAAMEALQEAITGDGAEAA